MAYPIKYMEDNLVFNHDGEVFAYYELIPYNYSFLSSDEKIQVHDNFCQLIAQNRDGKIHALQLATESSIRATQEQSKKEITGRLKEIAYEKIDEQTEALISMIGDNQVDYRFFIGFKLYLNEQEVSVKNVGKEIQKAFAEFFHGVNHKLMGDFVSMPMAEIERFSKMEQLLESKLSRRFQIRKLEKDDFGYIIEHLYGQTGVPFDDYDYHLPKRYEDKKVLVKKYDILKPTRCLIEENQRYLRIEQEDTTTYVAYFTINSIVGELDFPNSEIFYYQQQQFTFPVDTSMNVEIVANKKALSTVRNKKKELKDLDSHAWESDNETSTNVVDALESVDELESNLDQTKESMYKLSYVVRVSAKNLDELKQRCDEVKDFYDDLSIKLVRPFGDMLGLHNEFIPSSKRYINDYIQYVTSDFLAGLGFGATQMIGENSGIYVGYNLDTGRNIYLQPSLASQGIKGSVTNALASAFIGSLGGGKSFSNNMLVYYSVLFGGQATIVDLDEAWSFLQVAQGKALSMRLVRAGRAMNAGVYFVTQNADDLLDEKMKNNIGLKFAFRSTDLVEIKKTLEFFGVDKEDENNQKRLRELENGQCLVSDIYGRVGVMQFHPIFEELLHAFDTRPPVRNEVEE